MKECTFNHAPSNHPIMAKEQIPIHYNFSRERGRYGDEEPFVDGGIDGGGGLVVAGRDMRCRMLIHAIRGVCHRKIHPETLHFIKKNLREGKGGGTY